MPESANPKLPPGALAKFHFHGFFEESVGGLDRPWWSFPSVSHPEPAPPLEYGEGPPPLKGSWAYPPPRPPQAAYPPPPQPVQAAYDEPEEEEERKPRVGLAVAVTVLAVLVALLVAYLLYLLLQG